METFSLVALILGITAMLSVFNARVLRLPESIGLMGTALTASVVVLVIGFAAPDWVGDLCRKVAQFDFRSFVLELTLGFLVFAGAFMADTRAFSKERAPILVYATLGILLSTFLVGTFVFLIFKMMGFGTAYSHCLLFGALISPTDPIAVLAILKSTSVSRSVQADIAGESLLNDGVAVVVFLTIYQIAGGVTDGRGEISSHLGVFGVFQLFIREVFGGLLLGGAIAWVTIELMRMTRTAYVDLLLSLAAVMGSYAMAWRLEVSGPLSLVVVGLWLGQVIRGREIPEVEQERLEIFWESVDHVLNAMIFTMMGLVLLGLSSEFELRFVLAGILVIPIVLLARATTVFAPMPFTRLGMSDPWRTGVLLSWGGLRGGISLALALSLQPEMDRSLILSCTYVVVIFSILFQGLTIGRLARKLGMG